MHLVKLETTVTPERTLTLRVPEDMPAGSTEIIVVFAPTESPPARHCTLGDLRASEFFGMWRNRDDLPDTPTFARTLREQTWH
ncbi:MAG TPA: hypothetical protein ENN19_17750 [Chloroflexi bacterium]|nr:hypothetical protein [Chloroflexota bacterium]